jgi:hypothetical protein
VEARVADGEAGKLACRAVRVAAPVNQHLQMTRIKRIKIKNKIKYEYYIK